MANSETRQAIRILTNELNSALSIVTTTLHPPTYFHNCRIVVGLCGDLKKYESVVRFTKNSPDEVLQRFTETKDELARNFIDRFCKDVNTRLARLSSNEQKLKEGLKYTTLIEPFLDDISKANEDYYMDTMGAIFDEFSW